MRKITTTLAVAALALVACGGEEGVTEPKIPKADTPDKCMYLIERSFNTKDIRALTPHLAPDFTFYFNPNDVGQVVNGYTIPESWTHEQFVRAVTNMFKQVYSIELHVQEVPEPTPNETTFLAQNRSIYLLLMVDELNGYRTDGGYCDFEFEQYEDNGEKLWRLTTWSDYTSANLGDMQPSTLGRLLAMYYTEE